MLVNILGSAAGGAFPQWNCLCPNCRSLRAGTLKGKPRSQAQVAISDDARSWFLLGASPDLRSQIESTPALHPQPQTPQTARHSPIAGAILLNADLDHTLGLLLLRELQPLRVYATDSVRRLLTQDNSMFAMLQRVPNQLTWTTFTPNSTFSPQPQLHCSPIALATHYPAYVSSARQSQFAPNEASLGLFIDSPTGKRLAYLPAVPQIDDALLRELDSCDVLLFDGTFWSDDELIRTQGSGHNGQTAQQMGHVCVSSAAGSLAKLAQLSRPRKIYLHINNTNPMLNEAGPEYAQVRANGWEIAEDGWQFEL